MPTERIAGINVGPSQQWTNQCLLASGVLPSDTGKGDSNKVSSLPCKKPDIMVLVRTPCSLKSGQGNGLAWSRLTQQAHKTKPAVVAQKQASILCWLSTTWPHMTERWNGPTDWWVRHCTWWQEDENDSWCKNCIFLQTIIFSSFQNICCFFSSLSFFGFFWSAGQGIFARKIIFAKANHRTSASMKQLIDCEFLKLVCWLSPCEQPTAMTCVMFGGAELLFQITYCAPFIPDAKNTVIIQQHSHAAGWYSFARTQREKSLLPVYFGCLSGDCLSV